MEDSIPTKCDIQLSGYGSAFKEEYPYASHVRPMPITLPGTAAAREIGTRAEYWREVARPDTGLDAARREHRCWVPRR